MSLHDLLLELALAWGTSLRLASQAAAAAASNI